MLRLLFVFVLISAQTARAQEFANADALLQRGRYEEAFAAFTKAKSSTEQVLGQAACLSSQGKSDEAISRLEVFAKAAAETSPAIHAELARLLFARGRHANAIPHVELALSKQADNPKALFVKAELFRVKGELEEALATYELLTKLPRKDRLPDELVWIGRAKAQHARWTRDTSIFDRLVNDFYPSLLEADENLWQASLETGRLFFEKYNDAHAAREFNAALAVNPRAAEVHVAMGQLALRAFDLDKAIASVERALKINPNLNSALQLTADIAFTNLQHDNAVEPLRLAEKQNALDEGTLGRKLTLYLRQDGFDSVDEPESRATKLVQEVTDRNRHCGRFYEATGESFNALRIYPQASKYYQVALEKLPQLTSVRGSLGLVQMRLGEELAGRKSLEESFDIDPFNVRVKNTLDVLDVLDDYAVLETEHFVIRFDRGHDGLLAEYAARYLEEEVYPDIVMALDYEPQGKTLLEIFSRANGTSGHSWFSARMVGLPFIGTVGACAGKMFALTSPADGKRYNWARVLRHEFVHVVNLQQTNFLIPHWFTESLAVRNELGGYPADWDRILAKYVAEDNLFDLSNINHGFVRPGTSERWTLAYFQAYLYADFIEQLGGASAHAKMLESYADGESTEAILEEVTGKPIEDFEAGYKEFLKGRAGEVTLGAKTDTIEDLQEQLRASPQDASILAELAKADLKQKPRESRRYALKALAIDKTHPVANYAMARLLHLIGEDEAMWRHIQAGLDRDDPNSELLAFAARLKINEKKYDEAEAFYRLGIEHFPSDYSWTKGLTRALLLKGDDVAFAELLAQIADRESDKTSYTQKLTLLALKRKDFAAAEKWANRSLHVDVMDPVTHSQLAEALASQDKVVAAIREYETALRLSPGAHDWKRRLSDLKNRQNDESN